MNIFNRLKDALYLMRQEEELAKSRLVRKSKDSINDINKLKETIEKLKNEKINKESLIKETVILNQQRRDIDNQHYELALKLDG